MTPDPSIHSTPLSTPASAGTVWISARWHNRRGEAGAACPPRRVNLPAADPLPAGREVRLAA